MSRCASTLSGLVLAVLVFGGRTCLGEVDPSVACADFNGDDALNVGDPIALLAWLFIGGPPPTCPALTSSCGDLNRDDSVDVGDPVFLLRWLFLGDVQLVCSRDCERAAALDIEGFTFLECGAQGYPEYTHDQTGIVFIRLPGDTFDMGSPQGEPGRYDSEEGPIHEVTLNAFLIGKFEVTQGQWTAVMGSNPSNFAGDDSRPVEMVSWYDIQGFETKTGLTLPTAAQWEYACRAGTTGPYAGTGDLDEMGWHDTNSGGRSHPIGTKAPNAFGLFDMHGNVWELCEDVYDTTFYSKPEAAGPDPVSLAGSGFRVIRGGSWFAAPRHCRSAVNHGLDPVRKDYNMGFRLVAPLP